MSQAQTQDQKFAQILAEPTVSFDLGGDALDFSTASPERFIWNESDEVPPEFIDFGMFHAFEQIRIGYDPLERDRYEVRIYRARIAPERLAVAAEYATLFARVWGPKDFGVAAHTPRFGEVLGGDDKSGVMKVNRISVFRRGEGLLVLRQKFDADRFTTLGPDIARMVGSLRFEGGTDPRPFDTDLSQTSLPVAAGGDFQSSFPPHWSRVLGPVDEGSRGVYDFWVDEADKQGNLAAMLASVPAPSNWTPQQGEMPSYNDVADSAAGFARLALENLLNGEVFQLQPVEATSFAALNAVTYFNALYTFRAERGAEASPIKVDVLHTIGRDGQMLAAVIVSPPPSEPYLLGTGMHGNYVMALQLEAMKAHYASVQAE